MKSNIWNRLTFKNIIVGTICIVLMLTIVPRAQNIWELSLRKSELEKQKLELLEKNEILNKRLSEIESPEMIERIAREQLGLVKQGETFLMSVVADE